MIGCKHHASLVPAYSFLGDCQTWFDVCRCVNQTQTLPILLTTASFLILAVSLNLNDSSFSSIQLLKTETALAFLPPSQEMFVMFDRMIESHLKTTIIWSNFTPRSSFLSDTAMRMSMVLPISTASLGNSQESHRCWLVGNVRHCGAVLAAVHSLVRIRACPRS